MARRILCHVMQLPIGLGSAGNYIVELGAITAGALAVGTAVGFVLGSFARDLGADVDPLETAQRGAALGAVFGLTFGLLTLAL